MMPCQKLKEDVTRRSACGRKGGDIYIIYFIAFP